MILLYTEKAIITVFIGIIELEFRVRAVSLNSNLNVEFRVRAVTLNSNSALEFRVRGVTS